MRPRRRRAHASSLADVRNYGAAGTVRVRDHGRGTARRGPPSQRHAEHTELVPPVRADRVTRFGAAAGLAIGGAMAGGMLLAGCSGSSAGSAASSSGPGIAAPSRRPPRRGPRRRRPRRRAAPGATGQHGATARLAPASDIIYTAQLTVRAQNVGSAAARAAQIAEGVGGYVSRGHLRRPGSPVGGHRHRAVEDPGRLYPATLGQLAGSLGTQLSLQDQAQDVTEQVADVNSQVASYEAADCPAAGPAHARRFGR